MRKIAMITIGAFIIHGFINAKIAANQWAKQNLNNKGEN